VWTGFFPFGDVETADRVISMGRIASEVLHVGRTHSDDACQLFCCHGR